MEEPKELNLCLVELQGFKSVCCPKVAGEGLPGNEYEQEQNHADKLLVLERRNQSMDGLLHVCLDRLLTLNIRHLEEEVHADKAQHESKHEDSGVALLAQVRPFESVNENTSQKPCSGADCCVEGVSFAVEGTSLGVGNEAGKPIPIDRIDHVDHQ